MSRVFSTKRGLASTYSQNKFTLPAPARKEPCSGLSPGCPRHHSYRGLESHPPVLQVRFHAMPVRGSKGGGRGCYEQCHGNRYRKLKEIGRANHQTKLTT